MNTEITVNGKNITVKLSFYLIQKVQEKYKIDTINEAIIFIHNAFVQNNYDASIQILAYMSKGTVSFEEVGEWLFDNLDKLEQIFKQVNNDATDATPMEDTPGK